MNRRVFRLVVCVAAILAAAIPANALASLLTISIGAPSLTARTLVSVPVAVTCPPIDPAVASIIFGEIVTVNVQQASGRSFAKGTGGIGGPNVVSCDGATTTLSVPVLADPTGAPFHGGPSIVSASVEVIAGNEAFPGCGCGPVTLDWFATAGPRSVNLH